MTRWGCSRISGPVMKSSPWAVPWPSLRRLRPRPGCWAGPAVTPSAHGPCGVGCKRPANGPWSSSTRSCRLWLRDGARGLWHLFEARFARHATGILDFYHAAHQLWKGAAAWLDGRTTQARRWFGWARHRLRHGQPDGVLADLVEALEVEGLPASARDTLTALYAYLERHRDHLDYATYKELGLPMGSGMVESACKWLIQQRFKGVGMRWSEDGFNPTTS